MMYYERNIDSELQKWKEEATRKPLLLRGVRQCGKTAAVRHLGETFPRFIEINLEKQPRLHRLFEGDINTDSILARFEVESGVEVKEGETLLFLDEIQECPRAITALRYFYEEHPGLHIIGAGLLLEFVLGGKKKPIPYQFPVGRVRSIYMYPFSFEEYLTAIGKPILRKVMNTPDSLRSDNMAHDRLLEHYKEFLIVGGMPEAVSSFAQSHSFLECQRVQRDIILNYKEDFDKYDDHVPAENLRMVFEYVLHNACSQVRVSNAIKGMSAFLFKKAVALLRKAGLVYPVSASSCDTLPLGSGEKEANLKLIPFDTGVFLTELGLDVGEILGATVFDNLNKGNLAEISTGLEWIKSSDPYEDAKLFYWYRSGANAEVDYVIQRGNTIIPIEVKGASKGGMKSIRSFLAWKESPYGIRVSMEDFSSYKQIHVIPLYAVSAIRKLFTSN